MSHPNAASTVPIPTRNWKKVDDDDHEVVAVTTKKPKATKGSPKNKKRVAAAQPTPSPPDGKRQALRVNEEDEDMLSSESITMVDLQRLLHVMETNPAPKDRSKQEILMRADLCRDMLQKLEKIISDKDRLRVQKACQAAVDVAQTMDDPMEEDLVEKIFLKPNSRQKIAVVESSSKEEDEEPKSKVKIPNQPSTTSEVTTPPMKKDISPVTPSVAELQKQQREQIEEAIANMASQMKDQTAKIHDTLRNQVGQLDEMEQIAETNVHELTDVAEATQQHVKASWGRTFSKWTAIFMVIAGFVGTLLVILMIPKRPGACLFFCPPPDNKFCRQLPGGRKECVEAPLAPQPKRETVFVQPNEKEHDSSESLLEREKFLEDMPVNQENIDVDEEEAHDEDFVSSDDEAVVDGGDNEESGDVHAPVIHDEENAQETEERDNMPDESTSHQNIAYADVAKAAVSGNVALLHEFLQLSPVLIHQVDDNGWSLLHEAARMGQTQSVALLLEHGADPRRRTKSGQDVLDLARMGGIASAELIDLILQHEHHSPQESMDCEIGMDGQCIQQSSSQPNEKAVEEEAESTDDHEHNNDDDGEDDDEETVTFLDFLEAVAEGDMSQVATYLEEFPDFLDEVDSNNGWSGLHLATRGNHIDIVKLLLEEGADPSIESNAEGQTAYDIAVQLYGDDSPMAQLIAEYH